MPRPRGERPLTGAPTRVSPATLPPPEPSGPASAIVMASPEDPTKPSKELQVRVERLMASTIRPAIQADGGDIELVDIDPSKGRVYVHLSGSCSGCALSQMTLFGFVQRTIVREVPGIEEVIPT